MEFLRRRGGRKGRKGAYLDLQPGAQKFSSIKSVKSSFCVFMLYEMLCEDSEFRYADFSSKYFFEGWHLQQNHSL